MGMLPDLGHLVIWECLLTWGIWLYGNASWPGAFGYLGMLPDLGHFVIWECFLTWDIWLYGNASLPGTFGYMGMLPDLGHIIIWECFLTWGIWLCGNASWPGTFGYMGMLTDLDHLFIWECFLTWGILWLVLFHEWTLTFHNLQCFVMWYILGIWFVLCDLGCFIIRGVVKRCCVMKCFCYEILNIRPGCLLASPVEYTVRVTRLLASYLVGQVINSVCSL